MIGIDTNVVIRYITQDDPEQAALANELMASLSDENPGYISTVVLVEVSWVLKAAYKQPKEAVALVLNSLLTRRQLVVENVASSARALSLYENSAADFSDCIILNRCEDASCTETFTFDRAAVKAGMALLS